MKFPNKYIFFVFISFLGCSSSNYIITDEYKSQKIRPKLFAVAPFTLKIENKEQFKADIVNKDENNRLTNVFLSVPKPDFLIPTSAENKDSSDIGNDDDEKGFKKLFNEIFPQPIKKQWRIDSVIIINSDTTIELENRDLLIGGGDTIKIFLPKNKEIIYNDSISSDYVLFLNNFSTKYADAVYRDGSINPVTKLPMPNAPGSAPGVFLASDFAIWDNVNGKVVAYGHAEMRRSYNLFTKAKGTWEDCIYNFTVHILKMSPFAKKF